MRAQRLIPALLGVSLGLMPLRAAPPPPAGATVRVHLIDATTGRPVPGELIRMWPVLPIGVSQAGLEERTNHDGVATFRLRVPPPQRIMVGPSPRKDARWAPCGWEEFETREIMDRGASKEGTCWARVTKINNEFHPGPGEVYIFATRLTLWQRLWGQFDQ